MERHKQIIVANQKSTTPILDHSVTYSIDVISRLCGNMMHMAREKDVLRAQWSNKKNFRFRL